MQYAIRFTINKDEYINEVTTTPSTITDSEILKHRRRSQIAKY